MFEYILIFSISFITITLELFFTRILYLKAWNHVVYIVIPFAILGYGIGANLYLIFKEKVHQAARDKLLGAMSLAVAFSILLSTYVMIRIPIRVDDLVNLFTDVRSLWMILWAYTMYMIPFVFIGFLIVYLFSRDFKNVHKLYFVDLLGAGLAAAVFFPLIETLGVTKSLWLAALLSFLLGMYPLIKKHKRIKYALLGIAALFVLAIVPEARNYTIDPKKGWEWIPGYFRKETYQEISSQWHPLGRTDIYRMTEPAARKYLYEGNPGTFEINVAPRPEFAYLSTNFLAGTPAFNLSEAGLAKNNSQIKLFSQSMEVPYVLLDKPRTLVIGTGGGRDIFMAKSHGARSVAGAEINPAIVRAMRPGGVLHEYSGKVYTSENTRVECIDGRHLVKKTPARSVDLVILNGVDTFSGLSSGAYAYAESYLYTKNAFKDYFRILDKNGIINCYRWLFSSMPRETLRLHAIALEALKESGIKDPWEHIMIGGSDWSSVLIKKSPFTEEERGKVTHYWKTHGVMPLYPAPENLVKSQSPLRFFHVYTEYYKKNQHRIFSHAYPFDISVVTDDTPFFYKYYKLELPNLFKPAVVHHTGSVVFMTQAVVFLQSLVMILLFIFVPLFLCKKNDIRELPPASLTPFVTYFCCLGAGFMFIEIPLMQRFVFLLGSPIYSITVVLSVLLMSTGLGSISLAVLQKTVRSKRNVLGAAALVLGGYIALLVFFGSGVYDYLIAFAFWVRVVSVSLLIFPLGFLMGLFFPAGLQIVSERFEDTIAWAWGINGGFSVLGSILAIIIAQFSGFNAVLLLGMVCYLAAFLSFSRMERCLAIQ